MQYLHHDTPVRKRWRASMACRVGGKQILLDDPSGNPIELFEPFT
jgi:hypothetical protein